MKLLSLFLVASVSAEARSRTPLGHVEAVRQSIDEQLSAFKVKGNFLKKKREQYDALLDVMEAEIEK